MKGEMIEYAGLLVLAVLVVVALVMLVDAHLFAELRRDIHRLFHDLLAR